MAVKFEFYLADDDFNRLYAIKRKQGKDDLTGNEFARELLEAELYRLHPSVPRDEEDDECDEEEV